MNKKQRKIKAYKRMWHNKIQSYRMPPALRDEIFGRCFRDIFFFRNTLEDVIDETYKDMTDALKVEFVEIK